MSCHVWLRLFGQRQFEGEFPWFQNGGSAFGNWLGAIGFDRRAQRALRGALPAFSTVQAIWQLGEQRWVRTAKLQAAAIELRERVLGHDPTVAHAVALYAACCAAIDPREELAEDLRDVEDMARFAHRRRVELVSFCVELPDRAPPTGLSRRSVLDRSAEILTPTFAKLRFERISTRPPQFAAWESDHVLAIGTDAYANRLVFWASRGVRVGNSRTNEGAGSWAVDFVDLEDLDEKLRSLVILPPAPMDSHDWWRQA